MRIAYRVQLAAMVPIVGMLLLFGYVITEKKAAVAEVAHITDLTRLAVSVGGLVHNLQRERGASTVHAVTSDGNRPQLLAWRVDTDRSMARFESVARDFAAMERDALVVAALGEARAMLAQIRMQRADIDLFRSDPPRSFDYYTTTIARLLDIKGQTAAVINVPAVSTELSAFMYFTQAKERLGQIRALGSVHFAADGASAAGKRKIAALLGEQETFLHLFRFYATPEEVALTGPH